MEITYRRVSTCDRKVFESVLSQEGRLEAERHMHERVQNLKLLPWQEALLKEMRKVVDCNRSVFWIVDITGGAGKSVLCQYLISSECFGRTILYQDMDYRNNTYLYNSENLVLFDLPRATIPENLSSRRFKKWIHYIWEI